MPKRRRVTGTTYHLVHRPHVATNSGTHARGVDDHNDNNNNNNNNKHGSDSADDEGVMEWVHEADFRRGYRGKGSRGGGGGMHMADDDDAALLDVDALAAQLGVGRGAMDGTTLHDDDDDDDDDEYEDVSNDEHEGDDKPSNNDDDEDALFDDAVECEVTDDFLRQLMFGQPGDGAAAATAAVARTRPRRGDDNDDDDDDDDDTRDAADAAPPPHMDVEAWQLMSDEERAAVLVARGRHHSSRQTKSKTSRQHVDGAHTSAVGDGDGDGDDYPTHDTSQRALEAQFARMLHEFDVDACINDADVDDPRTHGALAMAQYMPALEEFVADRAGVDLATAEPAKNKGLLQQLRLLAHRAGAFDVDKDGGVFRTTVASEKEARFAAAFRAETERMRDEARRRVQQQQQQQQQGSSGDAKEQVTMATTAQQPHDDSDEELVTVEVKARRGGGGGAADRLDCESAVSAYSTYYNQPNVIAATSTRARRRGAHASSAATQQEQEQQQQQQAAAAVADAAPLTREALALPRHASETAEERRLRKQAVKAAQRARRHEKATLRQTYKVAEAQEVRRAARAQADRATVHFV